MNNTFDIRRFGLVIRKDLIENGKRFMLLFLTMLGLIALAITFTTLNYYNGRNSDDYLLLNRDLLILLSLMFFGFGIWFASTFSTPMNSKLKRLSYLVSPSSNLEKFLTRWILTTIGFLLAFFATIWLADILRVAICSVAYSEIDFHFIDITKLVSPNENANYREYLVPKEVFTIVLSIYFLLQSIFLLGSTFWEKASFIKTFTAVAAIITAFLLICRWAILLFYGDLDGYSNVFSSFELNETYTEMQATIFATIVISAFTITFWVLAFFRLKESEIIKRL